MTIKPEPSLPPTPGQAQPRLGWLGVIAGFLLGTMAAGVLVNILSDNPTRAVRALVALTGLAAVSGIAGWLRRYPGSTLQRTARITMWLLAAACVLLALAVPGWTIGLTAAAAALLTVTVLLATTLAAAGWGALLGGAVAVGFGVAMVVRRRRRSRAGSAWCPQREPDTASTLGRDRRVDECRLSGFQSTRERNS